MIVVFTGPMFAGKSTSLLGYERRLQIAKKKYLLVNHSFDTRYSLEGKITTHNGQSASGQSISVSSISEISDETIQDYDAIIIDESQFFTDLPEAAERWSNRGQLVVCAGLSGDFQKKPFEPMSQLISKADKIVHLTATCERCGDDAPFTKRISNDSERDVIGGIDKYVPRCRECYRT
jgi:thymidine kinase